MEATYKFENARADELPEVEWRELRACTLALRLCEPGSGSIMQITEEYEEPFPEIWRVGRWRGPVRGTYSYALDQSVGERIKQAWPACYGFASELEPDGGKVAMPVRIAANRFATSFDKSDDEDRLIDYMIAMEALLGKKGEAISYRIPLRLATLVGQDSDERKKVFNIVKAAYDRRSDLVHGSSKLEKSVKFNRQMVPLKDFLLQVQGYLIRLLRLFLKARDRSINKESLLDMIEQAVVTQDRTALEKVLRD